MAQAFDYTNLCIYYFGIGSVASYPEYLIYGKPLL